MLARVVILILLTTLLASCGSTPASTPTATTTTGVTTAPPTLRQVTLAMSYIPNVQFAPYYVAAAKGYFAEEGLEVVFDYNFETDVLQRAATWPTSGIAFATASGTSTLLARQQGIPVKTVMTLYQKFPIAFFAKEAVGLKSIDDLRGKTVGISGNFGESLYGLLAVRYAGKLDETAFTVQEIGFTQAQAVLEDKVEVAIGYAMNEPVLLRQQGERVDLLRVADIYNLAANGIVVSERLIAEEPELVRGFVRAALRGLQDTLSNPDEAFELSLGFIPEAKLGKPELQRQVLQESLDYWRNEVTDREGLGFTDVKLWMRSEQFMRDAGLLAGPVMAEQAFTNEFIR